jgi:hypothetical protein
MTKAPSRFSLSLKIFLRNGSCDWLTFRRNFVRPQSAKYYLVFVTLNDFSSVRMIFAAFKLFVCQYHPSGFKERPAWKSTPSTTLDGLKNLACTEEGLGFALKAPGRSPPESETRSPLVLMALSSIKVLAPTFPFGRTPHFERHQTSTCLLPRIRSPYQEKLETGDMTGGLIRRGRRSTIPDRTTSFRAATGAGSRKGCRISGRSYEQSLYPIF